jgi:YD repeat-containing protein
MLKKFRCILLGSMALLCLHAAKAQYDNFAKMVDFMPPAPNASAIIKYGGISINKNTGAPNISVPLFTLTGKKLSATVSLGYTSTGIKVDEIASRVGMGWALNAGGVVTRTLRGTPDESNTRLDPAFPIAPVCSTYLSLKKIAQSYETYGYSNGYDSEPDLFNFNMNGLSGTFIFDVNMEPVIARAEKFKIFKDFTANAPWNFKIINTDGVAYYFGGASATEKSKRENTCGKTFDAYLASAWYLTKIEHPNGEVINFTYSSHTYTYDNGVTQTMAVSGGIRSYVIEGSYSSSCPGTCSSSIPSTQCANRVITQGVLLNTIFNSHGTISFTYTTRTDCGDKLVDQVDMRDDDGVLTGRFNFNYNTVTANAQFTNEYAWGHDKTPYLTDLQEISSDFQMVKTHRFTYNDPAGRPARLSFSQDHWGYFNGQVNSVFIPTPTDLQLAQKFTSATANREPYEEYARKGMLNKITYPTGGADSLIYESNGYGAGATAAPQHTLVCAVTGTGAHTQVVKTQSITLAYQQVIQLVVNCIDNTNGNFDPLHNLGTVEILNSSLAVVFTEVFSPGTNQTRYVDLPGGNYTIKMYANGTAVTTSIQLKHYPVVISGISANKWVGGVRVKAIITGNPYEKPTVKKYYYTELGSNTSSLSAVRWPVYYKDFKVAEPCSITQGGNVFTTNSYCPRLAMYSNSLNTLYDYASSPISYSSVIEGIGENFDGGAVHQKFYTGADAMGVVTWGEDVLGAPMTNNSVIFNGKVKEETVLKKTTGGSLIPLKKTIYNYKIDTRGERIIPCYNVVQKWGLFMAQPASNCSPGTTVSTELINSFDIIRYDFISWWVYADSVKEINYDENGLNPVTKLSLMFYDNESHHHLTRIETTNSKSEVVSTQNKYPPDYAGQAVYDAMIARNIISPVVNVRTFNSNVQMTEKMINYSDWGNGNYIPVTIQNKIKAGPWDTEGTIQQVDDFGNILQYTGKDGVVNAIIWGYGNQYPVAKISGATYAQAVSATGVTMQALQTSNETLLRGYIQNIRTALPGAMVSAFTHKKMVGVTGITDQNNRNTTYSYDAFNRLLEIKDHDGKVLKRMDYHYTSSLSGGGFAIYFNQSVSQSFTPVQCRPGYTSNAVSYGVPAGKYMSFVSQADADAQATADMTANGQAYANSYALCSSDGPCTGAQYKKLNCKCETGIKIVRSSTQNQNGTWTCVFYYRWSDNSISADYTEITATTCAMEPE